MRSDGRQRRVSIDSMERRRQHMRVRNENRHGRQIICLYYSLTHFSCLILLVCILLSKVVAPHLELVTARIRESSSSSSSQLLCFSDVNWFLPFSVSCLFAFLLPFFFLLFHPSLLFFRWWRVSVLHQGCSHHLSATL